jgi:bacterioferritin
MSVMHGDPKVLGYLGRALSLELSAVQLYSTQARLVASWGLDDPARRLREESREELEHVERIIARMLALGAAPAASQLRPVRLGADLVALLTADYEFELELVQLYHDAATYCARAAHADDRVFFETLYKEEAAHAKELTDWIKTLEVSLADPRRPVRER